ncbi:hypothetical protein [Roseovarius sp. D0-M9]|uniref:hypothetical protein n=1 Tax=Roseovarius sp. D0-M9 TaxID=3127117 RepID=UPI00300FBF84
MDTAAFIETYGIPGAVILGLSFAVVHLWRAYVDVQNRRVDDAQASSKEIREVADAANQSIDALTRILERGSGRDL